MRVLGIDLGSREVKIVVMDDNIIVQKLSIGTMRFYRDYCCYNGSFIVDLDKLGIQNIDVSISTGYGRNNTDLLKFKPINEIKAHTYGAMFQTGLKDFVLLDIGGQDVKVVRVQNRIITDLELNDKCAASCGRYLENMASILEVDLDTMTKYFDNPVGLNSTCSVFSESELIGKIAEGIDAESLYAGVNYSLYKRLLPMLTTFKGRRLVLSGGVVKGLAIRQYLKNNYEEVICVDEPQFNGAIGCCVYGININGGEI